MKFNIRGVNQIAVLFIFLACATFTWDGDSFYNQRLGYFLFMALCFSWWIAKKYGVLVGVTFSYFLVSMFCVAFFRDNYLAPMGDRRGLIERSMLMGSFSSVLAWAVVRGEFIKKELFEKLLFALGFTCVFHHWFLRGLYFPDGYLMSPTFAAVYLVLLVPLALRRDRMHLLWLIPSILKMGGLVAYSGAIALAWAYLLTWSGWAGFGVAALSTVSVWVVCNIYRVIPFWESGRDKDRFLVWAIALDQFEKHASPLFGFGPGTWYQLFPWFQKEVGSGQSGWFVYGHNEIIQVLFESGWVGLGLVLILYSRTAIRSYLQDKHSFAFLVALVPCSLGMMPFRHDTVALLVIYSIHLAWTNRSPAIS